MILKIKKEDNIDKMWESILFAMVGKYSTLLKMCYLLTAFSDDDVFLI